MKRGYLKTYIKILFLLAIIASVIYGGIYFLKKGYANEQFETIKTNMLLIEAKTKIVAEKMKMKEKDTSYVGRKIEERDMEDIKALQEKGMIDTEEKENIYYILEKSHLEELGLTTIKLEEGYYIVEYNTNEIIYSKGVEDKNGNKLYKLTEIEKVSEK